MAKGVIFAQANPEAAIDDLYATHPEARNRALPPKKSRANDAKVLRVRMRTMGVQPGESRWGILKREELQRNIGFMTHAGLIDEKVDVDKVFTGALTDDINDFDAAAIRSRAARAAAAGP